MEDLVETVNWWVFCFAKNKEKTLDFESFYLPILDHSRYCSLIEAM